MSNVALQQSDAGAPTGSVGSFDTCYNQCKTYRYAIMYPNGGSGSNYNCFCANSPPTVTAAATCTSSTYYVYTHPASAAASGLTRRKELERLEKKRRAQLAISATTFCPEGYDACQISEDAAHGYECLKTDLELGTHCKVVLTDTQNHVADAASATLARTTPPPLSALSKSSLEAITDD